MSDLDRLTDEVLRSLLPDSLKAKIDNALKLGATKAEIITRARAQGGGRTSVVLAIEAYLGADPHGNVPDSVCCSGCGRPCGAVACESCLAELRW